MTKKRTGLSPRLRKHYKTRYLVVENGKMALLYRAWIEDVHQGRCLAICHRKSHARIIAKALNTASASSRR